MSADTDVPLGGSTGAGLKVGASATQRTPPRRWIGSLIAPVATAPYTCSYVLLLLVTTVLLRHVRPGTARTLLAGSSTDVAHLARDPLEVLVASGLWLPGNSWWP